MKQIECAPGNKPCGKRCIPRSQKCRSQGEGKEEKKEKPLKKAEDPKKERTPKAEEQPGEKKTSKGEGDPSEKKNNTKRNLAIGAAVLGAGAVALIGAGVATGKVKLPGQDATISGFKSVNGIIRDPAKRAESQAAMQQKFSTMTQEVSESGRAAMGKLDEGFQSVKAVLQDSGRQVKDVFSQGSLQNMAQTIASGVTDVGSGIKTSGAAMSTMMTASAKTMFEQAGADMTAVVDSINSGAKGMGDDMRSYWDSLEGKSPREIKTATLELGQKYLQGGRDGATAFMQQASASAQVMGGAIGTAAGGIAQEGRNLAIGTGNTIAGAAGEAGAYGKQAAESYGNVASQFAQNAPGAIAESARATVGNVRDLGVAAGQSAAAAGRNVAGSAWGGAKATGAEFKRFGGEVGGLAKDVAGAAGSMASAAGQNAAGAAKNIGMNTQLVGMSAAEAVKNSAQAVGAVGQQIGESASGLASSTRDNLAQAGEVIGNTAAAGTTTRDTIQNEKDKLTANIGADASAAAGAIGETAGAAGSVITDNAKAFIADFGAAMQDNMAGVIDAMTSTGQNWQTSMATAFGLQSSMFSDGNTGISAPSEAPAPTPATAEEQAWMNEPAKASTPQDKANHQAVLQAQANGGRMPKHVPNPNNPNRGKGAGAAPKDGFIQDGKELDDWMNS